MSQDSADLFTNLMSQTPNQSMQSMRQAQVAPQRAGNTAASSASAVAASASASEPARMIVTHSKDWWSIASEFVLIGGSLAALAYMFNQLISKDSNNPESTQKQVAEHMKQKLIQRMKKSGRNISLFNTNSYEDSLLDMIVLPTQIEVRFNDIGGLDNIKRDLTETVLVPLMYPQLTRSSRLCQPPLGVLFYGPPGTGKSMMAKAIARETNATFINVDMSRLMSKWYGDSQKYISALFSLARKMAPSIIWIDEIDALFSQRSRADHSADVYNKALFLSLWDGLANDIYQSNSQNNSNNNVNNNNNNNNSRSYNLNSANNTSKDNNKHNSSNNSNNNKKKKRNRKATPGGPSSSLSMTAMTASSSSTMSVSNGTAGVMVLGATNRPQEVDEAFLRRMSRQYEYIMPDCKTRTLILNILLQYENCDSSVSIEEIAQRTENYSGSDLKELCKYAATLPLREYIRSQTHHIHGISSQSQQSTPDGYNTESNKSWFLNMSYNNNSNNNKHSNGNNSNNNTNNNSDHSDVNTTISNECTEIFKELNNGSMLQRRENVHLRSITMHDFEIALKHIKSTMQAHTQHKQRYSKGSLYSMFDPFLASYAASAGSGNNTRRGRYTGPPTVSSRNVNNSNNNNYNENYNYNNNNNKLSNNNAGSLDTSFNDADNDESNNKVKNNRASVRPAGESADPMVDIDIDVE